MSRSKIIFLRDCKHSLHVWSGHSNAPTPDAEQARTSTWHARQQASDPARHRPSARARPLVAGAPLSSTTWVRPDRPFDLMGAIAALHSGTAALARATVRTLGYAVDPTLAAAARRCSAFPVSVCRMGPPARGTRTAARARGRRRVV